jgi:tetratricopeptide (TPR) repeat protein
LPLGLASILHKEASAAFSIVQGRGTRRDSSNQAFGHLLDEQGRFEAAFDCLRKVLRAAPDHTDAMLNLALVLQRKNQYAEATDYWRRYLAIDWQTKWATRACRVELL